MIGSNQGKDDSSWTAVMNLELELGDLGLELGDFEEVISL